MLIFFTLVDSYPIYVCRYKFFVSLNVLLVICCLISFLDSIHVKSIFLAIHFSFVNGIWIYYIWIMNIGAATIWRALEAIKHAVFCSRDVLYDYVKRWFQNFWKFYTQLYTCINIYTEPIYIYMGWVCEFLLPCIRFLGLLYLIPVRSMWG